MPVTVRAAGVADALALASLRWQWRVNERGEVGLPEAEFERAFASWMSEHRESHMAWLAEEDQVPVGMPGWRSSIAYLVRATGCVRPATSRACTSSPATGERAPVRCSSAQ